jgi:peptidoglycan/xylan/chitin deacetylase (PgdA/CDA1 family)
MQKSLAAALTLVTVACSQPPDVKAPSTPARATHAAPAPLQATDPLAELLGAQPEATRFPLLPAAEPASPRACLEASTSLGSAGLYRTDPWSKGEVVMTFDDGPHPTATPRVLDQLAAHELPATFFVVGRAINRDTYRLVQRVVDEGHTLGSHSYSHDVNMTKVGAPEATVETIVGQHAVTAMLIDISLVATSGDDFDDMFEQVFERDPAAWLPAHKIRDSFETYAARHRDLLDARGYDDDQRPYDVLYSRPPGGGPYVQTDGAAGRALYDQALRRLNMMNVMWHGASGDTVPDKRSDFAFLTSNMEKYSKSGGVLLVHDYMRSDALAHALADMAEGGVKVVPLADAAVRKVACPAPGNALPSALAGLPFASSTGG